MSQISHQMSQNVTLVTFLLRKMENGYGIFRLGLFFFLGYFKWKCIPEVWNIFPRHRCQNLKEVPRPPPPLPSSPLERHDFEILAPNIKISAPKFKYLVPKNQNVALNSNITDKIQLKKKIVLPKTSRFVWEKLPTQLLWRPPPPTMVFGWGCTSRKRVLSS